jgi:hypothetical protein
MAKYSFQLPIRTLEAVMDTGLTLSHRVSQMVEILSSLSRGFPLVSSLLMLNGGSIQPLKWMLYLSNCTSRQVILQDTTLTHSPVELGSLPLFCFYLDGLPIHSPFFFGMKRRRTCSNSFPMLNVFLPSSENWTDDSLFSTDSGLGSIGAPIVFMG